MPVLTVTPAQATDSQTARTEADQIMEFGATDGSTTVVPVLTNYTDMDTTSRIKALDMVEAISLATIRRLDGRSTNTPNTYVKRDGSGDFSAHDITINKIIFGDGTFMTTAGGGGGGGGGWARASGVVSLVTSTDRVEIGPNPNTIATQALLVNGGLAVGTTDSAATGITLSTLGQGLLGGKEFFIKFSDGNFGDDEIRYKARSSTNQTFYFMDTAGGSDSAQPKVAIGYDVSTDFSSHPAGSLLVLGRGTFAGGLVSSAVVESTVGGFKFPDGTTQTTAASAGVSGSGTAGRLVSWATSTTLGDTNHTVDTNSILLGADGTYNAGRLSIGTTNFQLGNIASGYGFTGPAMTIAVKGANLTGTSGWAFVDPVASVTPLLIRADTNNVGVGGQPDSARKLDVYGTIRSRSGGLELPDGTLLATYADLTSVAPTILSQSYAPLQGVQAAEGLSAGGVIGTMVSYWAQVSSFQNGEYHTDADTTKPGAWVMNMVTGTNGNDCGCEFTVAGTQRPAAWPIFRVVGKFIGTGRRWVGLTNSRTALMAVDSPTTTKVAAFRRIETDTNWKAVVCNGASGVTIVDTGVAYLDGGFRSFEIRYTGFTTVKFLLDGVVVATISTNVPTGTADTDRMTPILMIRNQIVGNASTQMHCMHIGRGIR